MINWELKERELKNLIEKRNQLRREEYSLSLKIRAIKKQFNNRDTRQREKLKVFKKEG